MHKIEDSVKRNAWDDCGTQEPVRRLTREQATMLRRQNPSLSPWAVLTGQITAGLTLALAVWLFTGSANLGWSALYGALAVVVPGALFARGLMSKVTMINPAAAVTGFFLWEMVKIGLVLALLFAAPKLVTDLSWPAMLAGLVATMKVVWLVLWLHARVRHKSK